MLYDVLYDVYDVLSRDSLVFWMTARMNDAVHIKIQIVELDFVRIRCARVDRQFHSVHASRLNEKRNKKFALRTKTGALLMTIFHPSFGNSARHSGRRSMVISSTAIEKCRGNSHAVVMSRIR